MSVTSETLVLDPAEFAPDREELALDELGLRVHEEGVDWGESQVQLQLTRAQVGDVVTDRHLEPVQVSVPLVVLDDPGAMPVADALYRLQQKVGIFQANEREPNWVRRDFDDGAGCAGSVGYLIYGAELSGVQGRSMAGGVLPKVTLTLLRSPLCYATEELESELFTEESARVLKWEIAEILGTAPGLIRRRIENRNASAHWRGLILAMESRDHPQDATKDTTAALTYQAKSLTAAGGAAEAERSGVKVIRHSALTAGWLTILSSKIAGVGHMTHVGVRRPWFRIYDPGAAAGAVELQLQFRPLGTLNWSSTNVTVPTPLVGDFALVDLGECRPEPAVIGDQRWEWRLQARAPSGSGTIDIAEVHLCPIEHYTIVSSPEVSQGADAQSQKSPGTGAGTGWTNPSNIKASDNAYATKVIEHTELGSPIPSEYLTATNFGFALPESSTPVGIGVEIERKSSVESNLKDFAVALVKASVVQTSSNQTKALAELWPTSDAYATYGSASDLWSNTFTATQINASTFGAAISVTKNKPTSSPTASVDHIRVTVYYTEAADENRVCFASRSIEVRSDGTYRQHPTDDIWGEVVPEGFNPQAPPSWLEGRALRGLVIASQGDLGILADTSTNKMREQVLYRPGYHFAREAV